MTWRKEPDILGTIGCCSPEREQVTFPLTRFARTVGKTKQKNKNLKPPSSGHPRNTSYRISAPGELNDKENLTKKSCSVFQKWAVCLQLSCSCVCFYIYMCVHICLSEYACANTDHIHAITKASKNNLLALLLSFISGRTMHQHRQSWAGTSLDRKCSNMRQNR